MTALYFTKGLKFNIYLHVLLLSESMVESMRHCPGGRWVQEGAQLVTNSCKLTHVATAGVLKAWQRSIYLWRSLDNTIDHIYSYPVRGPGIDFCDPPEWFTLRSGFSLHTYHSVQLKKTHNPKLISSLVKRPIRTTSIDYLTGSKNRSIAT